MALLCSGVWPPEMSFYAGILCLILNWKPRLSKTLATVLNEVGVARFGQAITFRRGYAQAFPFALMSISITQSEETSEK
jgi:hypothetical protein